VWVSLSIAAAMLLLSAPVAAREDGPIVVSALCPFELPEGEVEGTTIDCGVRRRQVIHSTRAGDRANLGGTGRQPPGCTRATSAAAAIISS